MWRIPIPEFPAARSRGDEVRFQTRCAGVQLATTETGHLPGLSGSHSAFRTERKGGYEVQPTGNAVNLEEEMMKVAANQMDYQAAASLYSRSLALLKTEIGKT
jgi:flagellar basal-body rod protein FlgB